jgi:hypothetical protein
MADRNLEYINFNLLEKKHGSLGFSTWMGVAGEAFTGGMMRV